MRVDDPKTERLEPPDECDRCSAADCVLQRYESYGPGYQVAWLCHYCDSMIGTSQGENIALAQGLHVLENRLRRMVGDRGWQPIESLDPDELLPGELIEIKGDGFELLCVWEDVDYDERSMRTLYDFASGVPGISLDDRPEITHYRATGPDQ